jgi:hypothetical protein
VFSDTCTKSRYWGICHTAKKIPIDDELPLPTVSREIFDSWLSIQPEATSVGVPTVGFSSVGDVDHESGGHDDGGNDDSAPQKKKSRAQKLLNITLNRLQDNHFTFMERCKNDKKFADGYLELQEDYKRQHANRKQRSQPGRQKLDRTRGAADVPKRKRGDRTEDKSGRKRARNEFGGNPVLQLRDRIVRHGLKSGDYVEIANDTGERWFMRIVNGKVLLKNSDDPVLASALWCETNDVARLSSQFTNAETCEIRGIIDAGPMSKFKKKAALPRD